MHRLVPRILACFVCSFVASTAAAQYRGPGDVVPAGSAAGSPGESSSPTPAFPGRSSGNAAGPTSAEPLPASTSAPVPGTPAGGLAGLGDASEVELGWQRWWRYHQHEFVGARARTRGNGVVVGSDDDLLAARREREARRPDPVGVENEVVPLLVRSLSADPQTRSAALLALGSIGCGHESDWTMTALAAAVDDPNLEVASTAALALGLSGSPSGVGLLLELVNQDEQALARRHLRLRGGASFATRAFAAYGLGLAGRALSVNDRARIARGLTEWFDRERGEFASVDVPAAALLAFGLTPLPLRASDSRTPAADREQQIRWLLDVALDRRIPAVVRAHAPTAVASLVSDLPRRDWLRALAVHELVGRLDARARESLEVELACALALGEIADADSDPFDAAARKTLRATWERWRGGEPGFLTHIAWARACARTGAGADARAASEIAGRELASDLTLARGPARAWCALSVAVFVRQLLAGGGTPVPALEEALRLAHRDSASAEESAACALALGIVGDRASIAPLRARLASTSNAEVSSFVALALGLLGDEASRDELRKLLARPGLTPSALGRVADALALVGDEELVAQLSAGLERKRSAPDRAASAMALGRLGDARALPALARYLGHAATAPEHAVAALALGFCARAGDLPWQAPYSERANYLAGPSTLTAPFASGGLLELP